MSDLVYNDSPNFEQVEDIESYIYASNEKIR